MLSTYSERILGDREVWITGGRVAAVKPAGASKKISSNIPLYDAAGGIICEVTLMASIAARTLRDFEERSAR